jgi:hypothetical protein
VTLRLCEPFLFSYGSSARNNTPLSLTPLSTPCHLLRLDSELLSLPIMSSPRASSSAPTPTPVVTPVSREAALQAALDRISSLEQRLAPLEQAFATMVVQPFLDDNHAFEQQVSDEQPSNTPLAASTADEDIVDWENMATRARSGDDAGLHEETETPTSRPRSDSVLEVKPLMLEPSMMSSSAESAASDAEKPSSPSPSSSSKSPAPDVDSEYEHEEIAVQEAADLDPESEE